VGTKKERRQRRGQRREDGPGHADLPWGVPERRVATCIAGAPPIPSRYTMADARRRTITGAFDTDGTRSSRAATPWRRGRTGARHVDRLEVPRRCLLPRAAHGVGHVDSVARHPAATTVGDRACRPRAGRRPSMPHVPSILDGGWNEHRGRTIMGSRTRSGPASVGRSATVRGHGCRRFVHAAYPSARVQILRTRQSRRGQVLQRVRLAAQSEALPPVRCDQRRRRGTLSQVRRCASSTFRTRDRAGGSRGGTFRDCRNVTG
jgi:hypothetical protein